MPQTLSCALGLLASVTVCAFSTKEILSKFSRNEGLAQQLWVEEFQSHACGRAISAVANFHAVALKYSGKNSEQDPDITAAEDFIRTKITALVTEQFEDTFELSHIFCFASAHGAPIAEVYRRDRHDSKDDDPKYSYRILNPNN